MRAPRPAAAFRRIVPLMVVSALLGVLISGVGWSLQWAVEDRKVTSFDMAGEVTVLSFMDDPGREKVPGGPRPQSALRSLLEESGTSLIVDGTIGNEPFVIYDSEGRIPWYPRISHEEVVRAKPFVYVFQGTYAQRLHQQGKPVPYLRHGEEIKGVLPALDRPELSQHVRPLRDVELPGGDYVLGTTDQGTIDLIVSELESQGKVLLKNRAVPLAEYLKRYPMFVILGGVWAAGFLCSVIYAWVWLKEATVRLGVRARHGADIRQLLGIVTLGPSVAIGIGHLLGVAGSNALLVKTSSIPVDLRTLLASAILGALLSWLSWVALASLFVWRRYEGILDA